MSGGAGRRYERCYALLVVPSRPRACQPREDMVVYGRVGQLVVIAALLGVDQVLALPTVAVVAALASMAVHLAGVDAGGSLALVLLDLDRFTSVNGAVGQHAGDELLRQVGGRLHRGAGDHEVVLRQADDVHRDEGALVAGWEAATGAGTLPASGVSPDHLVLEVTETELMTDPQTSRRVLAALVTPGVDISIDDHGTGRSSLAYLKDLTVGEMKLDRSFVADLCGGGSRSTAVVRTTPAALLDLGVDVTQGHHHGRPMPAQEMVGWALERSRPLRAAR